MLVQVLGYGGLLVLLLLGLSSVPAEAQTSCASPSFVGYAQDPSYNGDVEYNPGFIEFSVNFTVSQSSVLSQFAVHTSGFATGGNFRLGLYSVVGEVYTLLVQSVLVNTSVTPSVNGTALFAPNTTTPIVLSPQVVYAVALSHDNAFSFYTNSVMNEPYAAYTLSSSGNNMPQTLTVTTTDSDVALGITTCPSVSMRGDPIITGFHGQVYQVHGIPGRVFNLISSRLAQINARFVFLGAGESMTSGDMEAAQMRRASAAVPVVSSVGKVTPVHTTSLPTTTAWSHEGTFLGALSLQFRSLSSSSSVVGQVLVVAGPYQRGIASLEVSGAQIELEQAVYPLTFTFDDCSVVVESPHQLLVSTSEVTLSLVNSDRFFNLENIALTPLTRAEPKRLEGILGQSADSTTYFPRYSPAGSARREAKSDWQRHQTLDYLVADDDMWSNDFVSNRF